jgi:hypothetical protein
MVHGVDYDETFSYFSNTLNISALDVKTAFLNADMEHEVWMMPSENLDNMYRKLARCCVNTRLLSKMAACFYFLKRCMGQIKLDIDGFLKTESFMVNKADYCLYTLVINHNKTYRCSILGELRQYLNI